MKKIFWRVGIYFAAALVTMTAVAGLVFTRFNRRNIMGVYKEELKSIARSVSSHVSEALSEQDSEDFFTYLSALQDFGELRNTDILIMANPSADAPLDESFTNVEIRTLNVREENTKVLIEAACNGKTRSYSGYDSIYEMDMMHLATPVKNSRGENVGVVLVNGQMDYRQASVIQYQKYMFLSVVIALAISLAIAVFFSRQLVRPIISIK